MKLKYRLALVLLAVFSSGATPLFSFPADRVASFNRQEKVRAPELKGGRGWLNTEKPLSIAGLKGKVVLLDFWTYGCINCIHILPDLKMLEAKYADNLVVIGVHSAKFKNEAETENIRRIILRYGIRHPVVNDADYKIWEAYAVRAWPTQILIDPAGYVIGGVSGEGHFETLDQNIGETIAAFRKKGQLDETPLVLALERAKVGELPLAFPGKVLTDAGSNRLFISDSNHNRIVITKLDGSLIETIGSGEPSNNDGDYESAGFNKPQGLAVDGDNLYVADTENQRIRRVDLKARTVETIAGTGSLREFDGFGGAARETALRSPWDLEKVGNHLYIAMAGSHQIWRLDLLRNYIEPYAGTRWEARTDGNIKQAAFGQPSGIVSDGRKLFVADSETNIIREIDFEKETVSTLVGGDLFVFGDKDGRGDEVRLQHPLGITIYNGRLLLADTYNHKIKLLDAVSRTVKTLVGTGNEGQKDGKNASFYEPAGISVAGDRLFVADTNNHAIRVVDLKTGIVSTLNIKGLKPPKQIETAEVAPNLAQIEIAEKTISLSDDNYLEFSVKLPEGFHLNPTAPQRYDIRLEGADARQQNLKEKFDDLPLRVAIRPTRVGNAKLTARLSIYYCRTDNTGVCYIKSLVWSVPLRITADKSAPKHISLATTVK